MQKFTVSSSVLKPILAKLSQAVPQKSVLPVLQNIMFKVTAGFAELITTDLELTVVQRCECDLEGEPFEVLLPFQIVSDVVSFNSSSPLIFQLDKKGFKIIGPNDVYEIKKLEKVEGFPKLPAVPEGKPVTIGTEHIALMKAALISLSKDDNRPVLSKVLVEMRNSEVTIVSTDTNICFIYTFKSLSSPINEDLLLSPRVIKSISGSSDLQLLWNDKFTVFQGENSTIFFIRPEYKFPDWRQVIPKDYNSNLTLHRSDLMSALEKCSIIQEEQKTAKLTFTTKNHVKFSSADKDNGIAVNVDLEGTYSGTVESITVLADRMLKLMNQVAYDDIELAIHDTNKAVLLRSKEDEGYLALIMTMADGK